MLKPGVVDIVVTGYPTIEEARIVAEARARAAGLVVADVLGGRRNASVYRSYVVSLYLMAPAEFRAWDA